LEALDQDDSSSSNPNYSAIGPRPKQAPDVLKQEGRQPQGKSPTHGRGPASVDKQRERRAAARTLHSSV